MFAKTLKQIIGTFEKTLSDLDKLIQRDQEIVETNRRQIDSLRESNLTLQEEIEHAGRIRARIMEIVG